MQTVPTVFKNSARVAIYQLVIAMSSSTNDQNREENVGMSTRWGRVMPGSAKCEGSEAQYKFHFMPNNKDEKIEKIEGEVVAAAVDNHRDMFGDSKPVTIVYEGGYRDQRKISSIVPGWVNPRPV